MEIEVKIHQDQNGQKPFNNWFLKLDLKTRVRITQRINRIEHGNLGDYKNLGDGIYELRFFFNSGYRIYFGKEGNTIIIILCAGDKSSQSKDIEKAKQYWRNYE